MSAQRKSKSSRKDQQKKIQYQSLLSVPLLKLINHTDLITKEKRSSDNPNSNFLAGSRRSTDIHLIGQREQWGKLSAREKHVTYLVCKRKRNYEIAREMGVTVGTVNSYLHHIYNKLDIRGKMNLFYLFHNFDFRNNPPY